MPIAKLAAAPEFSLGAFRIRQLGVPSRGSAELSSWLVDLPPHGASGKHAIDREQLIVVTAGAVTASIGDEILFAVAGDTLILPINVELELRNDSALPASAIVVSTVGFKASAGGHTFAPPWSL